MPKDPIGMLGRLNAASLMMITPEFYKVRSMRAAGASKINYAPANFTMKPTHMQLDGLKIRYATGGNLACTSQSKIWPPVPLSCRERWHWWQNGWRR
jgi:hypothetical protein